MAFKKFFKISGLMFIVLYTGCRLSHQQPVPTPTPVDTGCGEERWSVKTGTDPDANLVNLNKPTMATIAEMIKLPAPSSQKLDTTYKNNRVKPYETSLYEIEATLTEYKLEDDSDYHLVIRDTSGRTMIVEIPKTDCLKQVSPFFNGIKNARKQFDAKFTVTDRFQTTNTHVLVTGVGFFDFLHGQTGVAPNGVELHPVLNITFH